MNDLVATLGIANLSKSQVSERAKDLNSMVEDFCTRPLDFGPYYYFSCHALTMKVRGRRTRGHNECVASNRCQQLRLPGTVRHARSSTTESAAPGTGFFRDVKVRGLADVYLVTSIAYLGIQAAGA